MTLTDVPGVRVGHFTDGTALTGVTVMLFPEPNVAAAEVRGAAPGSRELALLAPGMRVETIQAIVFSGGSAFGLAAADGVVQELAKDGKGHPTVGGLIPIVPTAVIYDLLLGDADVRPDAAAGAAAYRAASNEPVAMGNVGAGTGALIAGWRGAEAFRKGGVGSAAREVDGGVVGSLVVLNAVGDVFTLEGEALTGGPHRPGAPAQAPVLMENTTLVAVATDVAMQRTDLIRLTIRAQDALSACLRPSHTRYDGDTAFAVSCGSADANLDEVGEATFVAVGEAIEAAVTAAETVGGVASVRESR